jgi:hypothetical protein
MKGEIRRTEDSAQAPSDSSRKLKKLRSAWVLPVQCYVFVYTLPVIMTPISSLQSTFQLSDKAGYLKRAYSEYQSHKIAH